MTIERSAADEEIMRLATQADDEPEPDTKPEPDKPEDDDTLELGGEDAPEVKEGEEKKTRSHHPLQRINVLTARLREAERERDELKAKAAGTQEQPKSLEDVTAAKPDPQQFEFGEADPGYIEALTDWKLDLRDARRGEERKAADERAKETQARDALAKSLNDGMAAVEKAGTEKYDDFEAKITEAFNARDGEPLPPMVSIGITASPVGADVMYRLATDEAAAAKLEKLAGTNPQQMAIAFGELEGQYLDNDDDTDLDPKDALDLARMIGRERARRKGLTKPTEIRTTKAPKPAEHKARGSSGQFEVADDTDDFAAFERKYMGKK